MSLGPFEIGALLLLAALVFGPKMFVRAGSAVGEGVAEFKKAVNEEEKKKEEKEKEASADSDD